MPHRQPPSDGELPLLFLHAFPLDGSQWEAQRAFFGSDRLVLTPTFPGMRKGEPRMPAPSLANYAGVAIREMDAHGIDRAVVIGLSMGGYSAFRLYDLHPDRVAGLFLADTRAGADDEEAKAKRTSDAARVRSEGTGFLVEGFPGNALGKTTREERPDVVADLRRRIADADPEGVGDALLALRDRPDSGPLLPRIGVPVRVLVGKEDTVTPVEGAREIADGVPDGRLVVLPGVGHLANLEDPEAFNRALADFLDSLAP